MADHIALFETFCCNMTYNVFGGTLNLAQSINVTVVYFALVWNLCAKVVEFVISIVEVIASDWVTY